MEETVPTAEAFLALKYTAAAAVDARRFPLSLLSLPANDEEEENDIIKEQPGSALPSNCEAQDHTYPNLPAELLLEGS